MSYMKARNSFPSFDSANCALGHHCYVVGRWIFSSTHDSAGPRASFFSVGWIKRKGRQSIV
jgi:hypothetical protein